MLFTAPRSISSSSMRFEDVTNARPFSWTSNCPNALISPTRRKLNRLDFSPHLELASILIAYFPPPRGDAPSVNGEGSTVLKRPVIIHRAILGSVERFMAILTENFAGMLVGSSPIRKSLTSCYRSFFIGRQVAILAKSASGVGGTSRLCAGRVRSQGTQPASRGGLHGEY